MRCQAILVVCQFLLFAHRCSTLARFPWEPGRHSELSLISFSVLMCHSERFAYASIIITLSSTLSPHLSDLKGIVPTFVSHTPLLRPHLPASFSLSTIFSFCQRCIFSLFCANTKSLFIHATQSTIELLHYLLRKTFSPLPFCFPAKIYNIQALLFVSLHTHTHILVLCPSV